MVIHKYVHFVDYPKNQSILILESENAEIDMAAIFENWKILGIE